ncbi:VOC family protein [Roseivirga pacifica]|uniref:VOC family protein n=1 Tax=Roseivirga pacifica TaxID=1267423 RepID=UPI0020957031|nr:VOC family protein [Roseivirga pacifica]MCO6360962.1 VOC family protein [Roseivirga pacifica]MCO6368851.1 VOC family protein [Roseivirga pacifica]MCO6372995.1 VOC family protein [Roseivirga pacifica]MCO6377055.1 VOC family protein [Roseivirga pacifica]MCO6377668.1 VOC family protein [Roseivirga pacifica]
MARTSTYLNFPRATEEVFSFYKSIFQTEYSCDILRFKDAPPVDGAPPLAEEDKDLIMHVTLPITGGHYLMGTDAPESMGFNINIGNNVYINLQPDTRVETKRLFDALAEGGQVSMELQDMFWGDYYGSLTDKYGIQWMFNCAEKA